MDIVAPIIAILFTWRFLLSLAISVVLAFLLAQHFGLVASFFTICIGVGFGAIWQGRWLSGLALFEPAQAQLVSKPIAFIGFAFIGVIWGGLAGQLFGSTLIGALVLLAGVTLTGAWFTLVLKLHAQLFKLVLAAISLVIGFFGIYVYGLSQV
ncbi:MAG: hypothetical protein ACKVLM_20665 [Pseudomonadales bacterium]